MRAFDVDDVVARERARRRTRGRAREFRGRGRGRRRENDDETNDDGRENDVEEEDDENRGMHGKNDVEEIEREWRNENDLERLLNDASLARAPRAPGNASYFDVEWTIDALKAIERNIGTTSSNVDVAKALEIDGEALARHLASASLAALLDLSDEYASECGRDGATRGVDELSRARTRENKDENKDEDERAMRTRASATPTPSATRRAADDDWLDALLDAP